jgi:tocopherol O-methyltransferase
VTGVTISSEQVAMARKLSGGEGQEGFIKVGEKGGQVRFIELDAEQLGEYFDGGVGKEMGFDVVWISEALSHFPDKQLFFRNAFRVLKSGGEGKLVLADWFKKEGLTEGEEKSDIKPIEGEYWC